MAGSFTSLCDSESAYSAFVGDIVKVVGECEKRNRWDVSLKIDD